MASYHEMDLYYNCRTKQLCITTTQWSEICKTKPRSVEFLGAYEIASVSRGLANGFDDLIDLRASLLPRLLLRFVACLLL